MTTVHAFLRRRRPGTYPVACPISASPEPFCGWSTDFLSHRSVTKSAERCITGSSSIRGIREPTHLGDVIRSVSMSREKANEPPRGDTRPGAPTPHLATGPSAPLTSASCTPVQTKSAIQEGACECRAVVVSLFPLRGNIGVVHSVA